MLNPVPLLSAPYPLTHARVGYKSLITTVSLAAAAVALIPNTFERWTSASGTMESTFQLSSITSADFVAIGAHNLGSAGSTIVVSTAPTVAGTFTVVDSLTPKNNNAIMLVFDARTVADVKITITGGTDREVGFVSAGKALVMPRPIYGQHNPTILRASTEFQQNKSETGQWLGRNVIRKGLVGDFAWKHLEPEFIRAEFMPFVEVAKTTPFFISWRPLDYPLDVIFCHTDDDILPENMGGGIRLMSVQFKVKAHSDVG